jgi:hypothetical protein
MASIEKNIGLFARQAVNNQKTYSNNMFTDLKMPGDISDQAKQVVITTQDERQLVVMGVLLQPINYALNAEWSNDGFVSSSLQGIDKSLGGDYSGVSISNTGFATKKFYRGGGDLSTNLQFRIYSTGGSATSKDDEKQYVSLDPDGNTIIKTNTTGTVRSKFAQTIDMLKMMVLPKIEGRIEPGKLKVFNELIEQGTANLKAFNNPLTPAQEDAALKAIKDGAISPDAAGDSSSDSSNASDSAAEKAQEELNRIRFSMLGNATTTKAGTSKNLLKKTLGDALKNTLKSLTDAKLESSNKPSEVTIKVGTWFGMTNALITNIAFTYSGGVNKYGPLWCDISVDVVSSQNMAINSMDRLDEHGIIDDIQLFNSPEIVNEKITDKIEETK